MSDVIDETQTEAPDGMLAYMKQFAGSMRTDRKILWLSVFLLFVLGAVVSHGLMTQQHMIRVTGELIEQNEPAIELLLNVDRDLYQCQLSLARAALTQAPVERRRHLDFFEENLAQTEERFAAYKALAANLPGEAEVHAEYENGREAWSTAAIALAATLDPLAEGEPLERAELDAQLVSLDALYEPMRHQIDVLQEEFYEPLIAAKAQLLRDEAQTVRNESLGGLLIGAVIGLIAVRWVTGAIRRQERELLAQADRRRMEQHHRRFESRAASAMEMSTSEDDALQTATAAMREIDADVAVEFLLADSSEAHVHRAACSDNCAGGCAVPTPSQCPVMRRGETMSFVTSERFDACPFLRNRSGDTLAAVCVPLSIMGKTTGVAHMIRPLDRPLDAPQLKRVDTVVKLLGERLGVVRAFAQSRQQATTDPLTGLLNRRCIESHVRRLRLDGQRFAIAYGDIDRFKQLNDTHGHETGDRALRTFSDVLRDSLRSDDLVGRWGGEEFVVLMPGANTAEAEQRLQRIRAKLDERLRDGAAPRFTVSFGLCGPEHPGDFDQRLATADAALITAKRTGRDRVVVVGAENLQPVHPPDDTAAA